ncbi:MAG TPA: DUF3042 family protein [Limosilactobacillus coleohominis]|nr:DUF3042 family protein [Limosilactobacillus coleohominis]HJA47089.1 DUF3042 family protein [Candidatus Limosilactobacillus excrementigallinarum]HJF54179.1 DUF3042 family protein [Limosilactobacillus coleohominis]
MKQFTKGFALGTLATLGAVATGIITFHKTVIEPIEETEEKFDTNRRAANRKGRSAHQM